MYEQPKQQEKIYGDDYEKNRAKFWELLRKIEDPVVREALDTLHNMCTSFSIYHVAKHIREELMLDVPEGIGIEKGDVCEVGSFLKLLKID
jgi:hypothetical protein